MPNIKKDVDNITNILLNIFLQPINAHCDVIHSPLNKDG